MKTKTILKTIVAAAMLAAVTAAFFGAPTGLACRVQPAPTAIFLIVLLLTPLIGRLFCECFCPLGIIQSLVNWVFHPKTKVRRVCTRLPESRPQRLIRWAILALAAILIATGFGALGWLLTPYSIYGKALTLFAPGVAIFAVVVVLAAIGKGRVWCNWVCPVGTLFSVLAKESVCAHRVGKGCANCKACFGTPDAPKDAPGDATGAVELTRRDTLKGFAVLAATTAMDKTTDGGFAPVTLPGVPERPAAVLPPGAADRTDFNLKCVGCGLCVKSCRGGCLTASWSLQRFGQPEMDFRCGYCLVECAQACAQACPAGAIRLLPGVKRKDIHAGHAIWKRERCLRETEGVPCTACSRKCPVGAIHIVGGFPVVDKNACIGCGACEHVCPARPLPAIFVKGFERQRVVRPIAAPELLAEMRALVAKGEATCVAARDGVIVGKASGKGLAPLMGLLAEGKLAGTIVIDKVIGRAAAAVCIVGKTRKVEALLMGADAQAMLKAHGVAGEAAKIVPKILNQEMTRDCPLEQTVAGLDDPAQMVAALKSRLGQ